MKGKRYKTALIGSGMISYTYLNNMINRFSILDVVGCSDLIEEKSRARAEQFGIRQMTNEEILNDSEIEIVVNTTFPSAHTEVNRAAIEAGKHVYVEKTMGTDFFEALETNELAKKKGVRLSAAPDTFLGGGYQTCRKLIDDGFIGEPITAQAFLGRGYWADMPMAWERPGGMYVPGSSIPYDMGSYYLHALIHLLGPISRVSGFARKYEHKFTHPMHPKYGEELDVTGTTTMLGALEFANGVFGSLTVTGESSFPETTRLEVYGTKGTLICPDPNTYGGPVLLRRNGNAEFLEIPITHGYITTNKVEDHIVNIYDYANVGEVEMWKDSCRGIGVADMAWAIRNNRPHRCSGDIDVHALEVIYGIEQSGKTGSVYEMTTKPQQPKPLPAGFTGIDAEGQFDN